MGIFDAKTTQKNATPAKVVECEQKLVELEEKKKETIYKIGALYSENNDINSVAGSAYEELFKMLQQIDEDSVLYEKRKLALQGLRKCENCGNILVLDSAFCNKCGEKLGELFVETEQNPNLCKKCGMPYEEGAVFCTGCGNKLA
ncbi:MAG: zinc ribbon domain-containing protein [Lachnospiraceae bacterium]|nr:zinc ribbon domain-containing protein [Lachnospiraceae bacterium]